MKYLCRIFQISVAKFFKNSQNATNAMGSVSPAVDNDPAPEQVNNMAIDD
jgi:hypothetical protein